MKQLWWPLLILAICLPVALLALDVPIPGLTSRPARAKPLPVAEGDHELAYLDITTNGATWERLVTGMTRLAKDAKLPDVTVDESAAFPDSTTTTPELRITRSGHPGRLLIRWYKLSRDARTADWVAALAERSPAPIAIIGGVTTSRAEDLARELAKTTTWQGARPALAITNATADSVSDLDGPGGNSRLVDLYDDRTFRFCYGNRQMADAVLDFVCWSPDLAPTDFRDIGHRAACPPLAPRSPSVRPTVLRVKWLDDPYSWDLESRFEEAIRTRFPQPPREVDNSQFAVKFSVGGLLQPNPAEEATAEAIAQRVRELTNQRAVLVLPTGTAQARRFLRAVLDRCPEATNRLVVVTGDGIPVNALLRDGEYAWPPSSLPVPLVLFAHSNPLAWIERPHPTARPTATDDALHYAELGRVLVDACRPEAGPSARDADDLIARLHSRPSPFFDREGQRLGGSEFVVLLRPPAPGNKGELSVWQRAKIGWVKVAAASPDRLDFPESGGGR